MNADNKKKQINHYKRLKELRSKHNYSQKFVGNYIGISQRDYSHYENGEYELSGDLLVRLATLYDSSADYILELSERKKQYKHDKYYN